MFLFFNLNIKLFTVFQTLFIDMSDEVYTNVERQNMTNIIT